MKRGSPSLAMTEMQIKTTLRYHCTPSRMVRTKRNWSPPTLLVGMLNGADTLEESLAVPQNIKQNYHMLKTRQQAQNGVTHAKPHITKLKLNYSFSSPRNGILNLSLVKPDRPLPSVKGSDLATPSTFCHCTFLVPPSFCL